MAGPALRARLESAQPCGSPGIRMAASTNKRFLAGVIEGFYGAPWSTAERIEVLDWMKSWGLNTYLYGPKDDLHHRTVWRECYPEAEATELAELVSRCRERGIGFLYAMGPGLDVRYSDPGELAALQARFVQLAGLGCRDFSLLFDDIPDAMDPADAARWGTLAAAQCALVNAVRDWMESAIPGGRLVFCPTPYCGRMAAAGHGGEGYLAGIGAGLHPDIDVFWTGPEIVSGEITMEHVAWVTGLLRRPPLIWDNLHANDYDGRRFQCGPYSGRPPELRSRVRGVLTNPNNEQPLDFVALRTLAAWVHSDGTWDPRAAYLAALEEWRPRFATRDGGMALDELVRVFDCHYLPHEEGPEAERLFGDLRDLLARDPGTWGPEADVLRGRMGRLRVLCVRMAGLVDRRLFHAMGRRIWELREEMYLLERYIADRQDPVKRLASYRPDSHLPKVYRGGFVPRLQRLLEQRPDGAYVPAAGAEKGNP